MTNEPIDLYKDLEKLELNPLRKKDPQAFTKIHCSSCAEEIVAKDISLENNMAKCSSCNVIFSIETEVKKLKTKEGANQEYSRPKGVELFYYGDRLDITTEQPLGGLSAFFIYMIPFFAIISLLIYFLGERPISPIYPILFSLAGIYAIYKGLTFSKNKTFIDVDNTTITVKTSPKNFKQEKRYETKEIDQLYLTPSKDGMGFYTIHIILNTDEGQNHAELVTVKTLAKAKYLEQEIERYLGIKDRAVLEAKA